MKNSNTKNLESEITVKYNYSNLAYCPLDVGRVEVDEELVNLLIDKYNPGHHDGIWETLPLVGRVTSQKDFRDNLAFERAWERRYDTNGLVSVNELVYKLLMPIYDHFNKLPITVTHAQILRAVRDVPRHHDMKHSDGKFIDDYPDISYEPNGFKILLNNTHIDSFFICRSFDSDPVYIKLPRETNTFVINEKRYPHGAKFLENKCVVSIFGIVDEDKANDLIERSLNKYKCYIIKF